MSKIRVAINGFGRIGRVSLGRMLQFPDIEIVAINDLADAKTLVHLLKYDSIHGKFPFPIDLNNSILSLKGQNIELLSEPDPMKLPWKKLGVDLVLECTGKLTTAAKANQHLISGAKRVVISAPCVDKDIPSVVIGVNDSILKKEHKIISNASCTTNNVAPMIKILNDHWKVQEGYITTVHSYTGDQNLHDGPHKDLRRARAASQSIIPTTTGAAKAITMIFPELDGKLGGAGIRVPVPNGSLTDFTCVLNKKCTVEEINEVFKNAANTYMKGVLEYTEDPIVSVDVVNNSHSCIFDAQLTSIVGNLVKVVGWYDNEFGYSSRLAELVQKISEFDN